MTVVEPAVPGVRLAAIPGLFREIGDLKRVQVAHAAGSVAQRSFVRSWAALVAGADPGRVAGVQCAAAVAGARLAGVDAAVLLNAGLEPGEVTRVLGRAVDEVAGGLHAVVLARVHAALPHLVADALERPICDQPGGVPPFVGALCSQPRAGATAPGKPRLIVEPTENHGEHCWTVAVYGALLAEDLDADPGAVFLLGLAHHLHNASLPDAGFAGDNLLGEHLDAVQHRLTERELTTLPNALADRVRGLLQLRVDAGSPVGRAFHAADVLDRVLQVHHHARAAAFTVEQALVELELVHAGPVTDYQHAVLAAAGL